MGKATSRMAMMQPYFIPYLGYFNLCAFVDNFVFFDNADYIRNGWIQRNKLYLDYERDLESWITLPVKKCPRGTKINEIELDINYQQFMLNNIDRYPILKKMNKSNIFQDIFLHEDTKLSSYLIHQIIYLSKILNISCNFYLASNLATRYSNENYQDYIIRICHILRVNEYVNPLSGVSLYSESKFKFNNLNLRFLDNSKNYRKISCIEDMF
jgi:hypothetical protein